MAKKPKFDSAVTRETAQAYHEPQKAEQSRPAVCRDQRIIIRLSADELERIRRHCDFEHIPVSTWMRKIALDELRRRI